MNNIVEGKIFLISSKVAVRYLFLKDTRNESIIINVSDKKVTKCVLKEFFIMYRFGNIRYFKKNTKRATQLK